MPSATFFRLPEEKKARLMGAALEEFTRVPFVDASINRIVLKARIPRGSFYQYFEDKSDLFCYLIDLMRDKFLALADEAIERTEGNVFALPAYLFDAIVSPQGRPTAQFTESFAVLQRNGSANVRQLLLDRTQEQCSPKVVLARIDRSCLRARDDALAESTIFFLIGALGDAIAQTVTGRGTREEEYERLKLRVEIIKSGSGVKGEEK